MSESKHTPCNAEYVPSTEHHGPYITTEFGSTMCDFYAMSKPSMLSTASGGPSKPMHFLREMADDNARRFTAAWNACAKIPTEALEAGVVAEIVEVLKTAQIIVSDRVAGGRMLTPRKEAKDIWDRISAILAKIGGAS